MSSICPCTRASRQPIARTVSTEPPDLRKPAGRTLCPQTHPAGRTCAEQSRRTLSGGGYHPIPRTSSVRNGIPAQVTTMITAPGRRRQLQRPATEELKTPARPGAIRRHPTPAHRKQMTHRVTCQASTTATDLPAELVTLIDLPCTPEIPGIHLPWTCAAPGPVPATTPTHPILPKWVLRPHAYLSAN
jgi:hypothetical protein